MKTTLLLLCFFIIPHTGNAQNIQNIPINEVASAWLTEEHSLPIISYKITFKNTGSAYDPDGKFGLAQLSSGLLFEGAGSYNAFDFKKRLQELAIKLNIATSKDHTTISLKTLTENHQQALTMLTLMITQPLLSEDAIARDKQRTLISIAANNENPQTLANLTWAKTIFANHPYAHSIAGTKKSIASITKQDIQHYIQHNFRQSNMQISVVGDVSPSEITKLLRTTLGSLPHQHTPTTVLPTLNNLNQGNRHFIEKPNPQSVVTFGSQGVTYKDPDFYPAYILNHILGGGSFESRLMQEIREERGLVYSIYSYLAIYQHAALLKGGFATKNETVEEAIALLKEIFSTIRTQGITAEELHAAKQYLIGSYPLRLDTNSKLANGLAFIQLEELGIDFMKHRNQKVQNVTLEQVNNMAQKLLAPNNLNITVVGGK